MEGERHKYIALLKLKAHASKIASSCHELRVLSDSLNISSLYRSIQNAMADAVSNPHFDPARHRNLIRNSLELVKSDLEQETGRKLLSGLNLFTNSLLFLASASGIVIFGAAIATGPFGIALLGVAMTILSGLMLAITAYSLYVDGRNLFDVQLKEIEEGINFLDNYPALVQQSNPGAEPLPPEHDQSQRLVYQ